MLISMSGVQSPPFVPYVLPSTSHLLRLLSSFHHFFFRHFFTLFSLFSSLSFLSSFLFFISPLHSFSSSFSFSCPVESKEPSNSEEKDKDSSDSKDSSKSEGKDGENKVRHLRMSHSSLLVLTSAEHWAVTELLTAPPPSLPSSRMTSPPLKLLSYRSLNASSHLILLTAPLSTVMSDTRPSRPCE